MFFAAHCYSPRIPSTPVIVGIDEAGRGPLAGPVVAAACVLDIEVFKRRPFGWGIRKRKIGGEILLGDSKMLSETQRERAYEWIIANCTYGVGMSDAREIDTHGILIATEKAMHVALGQIQTLAKPTKLLVDGNDDFWFDVPHDSVVRGDSLEPAIAAASIVAKVTRDRLMKDHCARWPQYGFSQHKGYGSERHLDALKKHGVCPLHRKSYLQKWCQREGISDWNAVSSIRKTESRKILNSKY